ncbi:lipocalin family protein [Phenylobacterium sp.]|jgi:apolipoprotein D and lipocalin family protein|uniref:lipocalin family protein n=1 Tax=Phenylobacterium sp. TaxID=1871053 RepID=UPI0035B3948C
MRALASTILAAAVLLAGPAFAAPPAPTEKIELTKMMGRWYEVARLPNKVQNGCQGGTSTWQRVSDGFSVVQACHKGSLTAPVTEWKAKAKVLDPSTNAKLQMTFFNGLVKQEYWVLEHRPDQGWLILGTPGGRAVWLMSQRPTLPAGVKTQALARLRQLGYDVGRLEFPLPAKN